MGRHDAAREREDIDALKTDQRWPGFVLPLKRHRPDGDLETAVLAQPVGDGPVILYRGNMFAGIDPATAEKVEYPSAEACIIDGWEVD